MGGSMENYIVRVYRRDIQNTCGVTGLVENVENEEKLVFHSLEELCSILSINPVKVPDHQAFDAIRVGPRQRS
jgi:hypothetical protein